MSVLFASHCACNRVSPIACVPRAIRRPSGVSLLVRSVSAMAVFVTFWFQAELIVEQHDVKQELVVEQHDVKQERSWWPERSLSESSTMSSKNWWPERSWSSSCSLPYAKTKIVEGKYGERSLRDWWEVPCRDGAACANPECLSQHETGAYSCKIVPLHRNEVTDIVAE